MGSVRRISLGTNYVLEGQMLSICETFITRVRAHDQWFADLDAFCDALDTLAPRYDITNPVYMLVHISYKLPHAICVRWLEAIRTILLAIVCAREGMPHQIQIGAAVVFLNLCAALTRVNERCACPMRGVAEFVIDLPEYAATLREYVREDPDDASTLLLDIMALPT